MPILKSSTFVPSKILPNGHFQTIVPSYFAPLEQVDYEREIFDTPDQDQIAIDWARVQSDKLVIINHGLCGHSHRHYVLSFARTFNDAGWDCLAWNYRGTSEDAFLNPKLTFTTNNSTQELDWMVRHAIQKYHYKKIALTGFSMGGNLAMLYLGRETATIPAEVVGATVVCAVTDLFASNDKIGRIYNRLYSNHLVGKLHDLIRRKHQQFPDQINLEPLNDIKSFDAFDDAYTAPMIGFKDHNDYWAEASAMKYLHLIDRKALMIAPQDDPFLDGQCYPFKQARENPNLYLEIPVSGGHCGFVSHGHPKDWWPAQRAVEFLKPLMD